MTASRNDTVPSGDRITQYDSQGVATSGIVATVPATIIAVYVYNDSTSIRYLHLFDSVTVPADASVPVMLPLVCNPGQNSFLLLDGQTLGEKTTTGLSWASSSTPKTKTITLAADLWVTARYV